MENKMKKLITLLAMTFLFLNCSGQTLLDTTDTSLSSDASTLKTVSLWATHHPAPLEDGSYPDFTTDDGAREFTTNLGFTVKLTKALGHWTKVDLYSEEGDTDCDPTYSAVIDTNFIYNFLGTDLEVSETGVDDVTAVPYCRFRITFGPATADSMHAGMHGDLIGSSVLVSGTYTLGGTTGSFEFAIDTELLKEALFKAKENDVTIDHALHFDSDEDEVSPVFGTKYNKWFDDIDFTVDSDELQEDTFADNFLAAFHQHLGDHHGMSDDMSGHDH